MKTLRFLFVTTSLLLSTFCYPQSGSARTWFDTTYFQLDSVRLWHTINRPDYTIEVPADWVYDSTNNEMGADIILQTYQETPLDSFSENVTIMRFDINEENGPVDLISYTENSYELLNRMWNDFKEEVNTIEHNHQTAFHKWIYSGSDKKYRMRFEQYTFIKEQIVYIITLTTEADKFYRYKDVGEKILNSFSFR